MRRANAVKMINNHTAAFTLPAMPGYPLGITLEPGETVVPDGYLEVMGENPTVKAWFSAGLIDFASETPDPPSDPAPKKKAR